MHNKHLSTAFDRSIDHIAVLIPAYNPDKRLLNLIDELTGLGFRAVIVVNDGSDISCMSIFEAIAENKSCHLLHHTTNVGKGKALKTGLNHYLEHIHGYDGVVTCDADGQHLAGDVLKVAIALKNNPEFLVLGSRMFCANVPLRSRLGNIITRKIFYILTGKLLSDTQTGLRGIPAKLIQPLVSVEGEGYEYEMNMLIATKKLKVPIIEEAIQTIYFDNNRFSNFNPLRDSMKIYFLLLRFCFSSLMASALDVLIFSVSYKLTSNILMSIFIGRYTIGPLVNFVFNRNFVFNDNDILVKAIVKYYLLATLIGLVAYVLIKVLMGTFVDSAVAAKIIAESLLFIASFTVQRYYIFTNQSLSIK